MDLAIEIDKITQTNFFTKMGVKEFLGNNIILLKDVEQAFVNPTEEAFAGMYKEVKWLPSALTDTDPFYKNIQIPENLLPYRKEIVQLFLKKNRNLDKKLFSFGAYDFTEVAKKGITFAFRQYLVEKQLSLGNFWENIVNVYNSGHWAIGYYKEKIFAI
ncbi:MAG: hypothetical protein Q3983_09820 [Capnocytophaga sp.]|nr:hypothetical protein [Capnocytophaga sp.]